ncbi:DUF1189 family protein [Sediminibacillus massiliensis]|uniref:DUF1189 family protein n=1 Tax=Sediminibacillus massiliensis TaxID=1926277 RepID=UPI00098833CA|nr:DUF1189 family protein [Sediminibacillus massiliensis]
MELFISFKNSLLLPKKHALFRLNRISMRNTIVYIFLLMFLLFLPEVVHSILHFEEEGKVLTRTVYIMEVIIFYPFSILFMVVTIVSLLAGLSVGIKKAAGRKLKYQQLWKMTSFAMTVPLIVFTILRLLFGFDGILIYLVFMAMFCFLMYRMITVYPKRAKRSK